MFTLLFQPFLAVYQRENIGKRFRRSDVKHHREGGHLTHRLGVPDQLLCLFAHVGGQDFRPVLFLEPDRHIEMALKNVEPVQGLLFSCAPQRRPEVLPSGEPRLVGRVPLPFLLYIEPWQSVLKRLVRGVTAAQY